MVQDKLGYFYFYMIAFTYNADGIRTSKAVNGVKHEYLLNGSQILGERWTSGGVKYTLIYLYDENGSPMGLKYRTNAYAANEYDYFFFEKNLQGDIVAVYNASGTKIGSYIYDAWGVCTTSVTSGNTTLENSIVQSYNPFRYRGYYYDTQTGLYYLQSRYYNPTWGRFISADGYVSTGTGLLGYNMFAYCNNNPVMLVDPTGDFPWVLLAVAVVACLILTSCDTPKREESYRFTSFDSYEDAYTTGMKNTYTKASNNDFQYEYGCVIVQYENDDKYYLSQVVTDRQQESVDLPFPKDVTPVATIHSHPWWLSEPYSKDGERSHDQFIVDIDGNGYLLPQNTIITGWEIIEWE